MTDKVKLSIGTADYLRCTDVHFADAPARTLGEHRQPVPDVEYEQAARLEMAAHRIQGSQQIGAKKNRRWNACRIGEDHGQEQANFFQNLESVPARGT